MSSSSLSSLVNNAHAAKHATSNSGPLSSFDKNAASLTFHCPEVLVLLRPDSAFVSSGISSRAPWPTIRGALELDLPKTRKIEGIEVERGCRSPFMPPMLLLTCFQCSQESIRTTSSLG